MFWRPYSRHNSREQIWRRNYECCEGKTPTHPHLHDFTPLWKDAKKNTVCQIFPRPPNQCWSLFPALWSFRVWSTLYRGEGGKFYLGLEYSKIRHKRSSVSLILQPIVAQFTPHSSWHVLGCVNMEMSTSVWSARLVCACACYYSPDMFVCIRAVAFPLFIWD